MMDLSTFYFYQYFYITEIQKLAFHLPHVRLIGMHQCIKTYQEALKSCSYFQNVLCCHDYSERVVAIFLHQIQSE